MLVALLFLAALPSAVAAATIQGSVVNGTTNKPAAGDTVALIRMQQGMQVAGMTTTDSAGRYTLPVNDSDPIHLVRVTHQGANYFQAAQPGAKTIDVKVYDVAQQVAGVSTEADLTWMEADGNTLQAMEIFIVKNDSSPPKTQLGPAPYPFYLPKGAEILSAAALAPGSMPIKTSPARLQAPGGYSFTFPIRPGETRLQVAYRMPYTGAFEFQPRFGASVKNFAVVLPKSMSFSAKPATAFRSVNADPSVQTYLAKNVTPAARLTFRIEGTGQLPQQSDTGAGDSAQAQRAPASPEAAARQDAIDNTRPGIGLGVPIGTPSPLDKYKWWILSAVVILLVVGAGFMMRQGSTPVPATANAGGGVGPQPGSAPGIETPPGRASPPLSYRAEERRVLLFYALMQEMSSLESDRRAGRISGEEYERQKSAIEAVLERVQQHEPLTAKNSATV
jgi:hypothetical protein